MLPSTKETRAMKEDMLWVKLRTCKCVICLSSNSIQVKKKGLK